MPGLLALSLAFVMPVQDADALARRDRSNL
jgi:hypothetical protein